MYEKCDFAIPGECGNMWKKCRPAPGDAEQIRYPKHEGRPSAAPTKGAGAFGARPLRVHVSGTVFVLHLRVRVCTFSTFPRILRESQNHIFLTFFGHTNKGGVPKGGVSFSRKCDFGHLETRLLSRTPRRHQSSRELKSVWTDPGRASRHPRSASYGRFSQKPAKK